MVRAYGRFLNSIKPTMPIAIMTTMTPTITVVIKVLVCASSGIGVGTAVDAGTSDTVA